MCWHIVSSERALYNRLVGLKTRMPDDILTIIAAYGTELCTLRCRICQQHFKAKCTLCPKCRTPSCQLCPDCKAQVQSDLHAFKGGDCW